MKKYKTSKIISKIFFGSTIVSLFTNILNINNKDKRIKYIRIISILSTLLSLIAAWFLSVPSKKKNDDISDEDDYDDFDIEDLENLDENSDLEVSDNQEYINSILDKDSFSQKDIIAILKSGITLSDYRNKLIGKTVILNNSSDYRPYYLSSNSRQYVIADINHQDNYDGNYDDGNFSTPNSIDLIASGIVCVRNFGGTSPYGKWSTSDIRTWLNDTFKNGFDSEVQELMSKMIVETYFGSVINKCGGIMEAGDNTIDYVKLLSLTELNLSIFSDYMPAREGTPYADIFTKAAYDTTNTSRIRGSNPLTGNYWWTRSMHCSYPRNVWLVSANGNCNSSDNGESDSNGVVPVIRLKAI